MYLEAVAQTADYKIGSLLSKSFAHLGDIELGATDSTDYTSTYSGFSGMSQRYSVDGTFQVKPPAPGSSSIDLALGFSKNSSRAIFFWTDNYGLELTRSSKEQIAMNIMRHTQRAGVHYYIKGLIKIANGRVLAWSSYTKRALLSTNISTGSSMLGVGAGAFAAYKVFHESSLDICHSDGAKQTAVYILEEVPVSWRHPHLTFLLRQFFPEFGLLESNPVGLHSQSV